MAASSRRCAHDPGEQHRAGRGPGRACDLGPACVRLTRELALNLDISVFIRCDGQQRLRARVPRPRQARSRRKRAARVHACHPDCSPRRLSADKWTGHGTWPEASNTAQRLRLLVAQRCDPPERAGWGMRRMQACDRAAATATLARAAERQLRRPHKLGVPRRRVKVAHARYDAAVAAAGALEQHAHVVDGGVVKRDGAKPPAGTRRGAGHGYGTWPGAHPGAWPAAAAGRCEGAAQQQCAGAHAPT